MYPFMKSLDGRQEDIQAWIDREQARPAPEQVRLCSLKRLLREQIEFIKRIDRAGDSVPIPVVRRRSLKPAISRRT
jgi:hypothetical protein